MTVGEDSAASMRTVTQGEINSLQSRITVRLGDSNFVKWNFQFQSALEGHDLFDYFDGSCCAPSRYVVNSAGTVTNVVTAAYKQWKMVDRSLISLLMATLDDDTMDLIVGCRSCHEAWIAIQERFSSISRASVMQLKTDLQTIQKGADSIKKYLQRIKHARDQLSSVGITLLDEDIVVLTLSGLPGEYGMIKTVIRARDNAISLNDLRSQLLATERDVEMHFSVPGNFTALAARNGGGYRGSSSKTYYSNDKGKSNWSPGGSSTGISSWTNGSSSSSNSGGSGVECPKCGKRGHNVSTCYKDRICSLCNQTGHIFEMCFSNPSSKNYNPHIAALRIAGAQSSSSSKCQLCMQRGHIALACSTLQAPSHAPASCIVICQICSVKGHTALNCPQRRNFAFQGDSPPSSLIAMSARSFDNSVSGDMSHMWIGDSGATHHMTSDIRKPSKSADSREFGDASASASSLNASIKRSDLASDRPINANSVSVLDCNGGGGSKLPQVVNSKLNGSSVAGSYEALPAFRDVPGSEKQLLFVKKLNLCSVVFDFTDPVKHLKEKDIKRQTLLELVDHVSSASGKFSETFIQEAIKMVSVKLFRSLSPQPRKNKILAWLHLQIVYEFLLRFVASPETDAKLAKRYIDQSFVLKLLDLFDSEDPREREYLKTILHRIYGKFMVHRPFIRMEMNNIFYRFIFETEKHSGIAEMLEVLGSIISEFALPLKEEHKLFLTRALIPLHKPKCLSTYHQKLSYCITQFIEKDGKLTDIVIRGLLKYWPITSSLKEIMFLSELEEILEATQPAEFQRCMVPLFRRIARCLSSSHFQVAERALFLWNNDHIENLIKQNRKVILRVIFPALEKNGQSHWNQAVHSLSLNVRKIFSDADPELVEECVLKFQGDEAKMEETKRKQETTRKRLEEIAASRAG